MDEDQVKEAMRRLAGYLQAMLAPDQELDSKQLLAAVDLIYSASFKKEAV